MRRLCNWVCQRGTKCKVVDWSVSNTKLSKSDDNVTALETAWWRLSLRSCLTHTTPPAAVIRYSSKQTARLPKHTVTRLSGSIYRPFLAEDRANASPVCARFVVDKVALWRVALCAFQLCPVTIMPPMCPQSCHRFCIAWSIDSVFDKTRYKKLTKEDVRATDFYARSQNC